MVEPESVVVITAKSTRINALFDPGSSPWQRANVGGKIIVGEAIDESGTIGTVGIEA